jgi:hypothetical protein
MQAVKDELHQAADSVHKAGQAAFDKIVDPGVRGHLSEATRHLLRAGKAALDAAEKHCGPTVPPAPYTTSTPVMPVAPVEADPDVGPQS